MKFVTAKTGSDKPFIGLVIEKTILHIQKAEFSLTGESWVPDSLVEAIDMGELFISRIKEIVQHIPSLQEHFFYELDSVQLLSPIPKPRKNIICVGKNYADHAIEMGSAADIPEDIIIFTKAPTTVIGHKGIVLNHSGITNQLDYEGELAIVIGKEGIGIPEDRAKEYIFGYTILNDITARDLQAKHKQFFLGKSLDTTCPIGPWIVHSSHIEDPNNLHIATWINGEKRQDSNTQNCIFSIEKIISILSRGMTLQPGDIIATGTPAGVGKGFKPPKFLKPGDIMEVTVEGIGTLRNKIEG
ncbi:fumarylacetoacetate hydrolase family protein [Bacillus salitolerans]|uniref:Fumarylacetoacetate hydrolase family protein n=1 Tax=Bacillus salitolerans TaxID=1437434 RepID=A0ABW4LKM8_9BACI